MADQTPSWQSADSAPGAPPATTVTAVDNPLPGDRYLWITPHGRYRITDSAGTHVLAA